MIEQQAKIMIEDALTENTSDIHILPRHQVYAIYFRVNGEMVFQRDESEVWGRKLISYFKFLANLDVGEKRKPQSGSIHYQLAGGAVELRLSTITNVNLWESLVIRLIRQVTHHQQALMTYFPNELAHLRQLVRRKSGLLLFSGPVGSGKTTTIYQLLRERMKEEPLQVITMEDPVEIIEETFLQTEVNLRADIDYDVLIKASLRHHPDVLLIGEIRDEITARMVIRGALTGHLMIATIHAKNTLGVIGRLQELSVSNEQIRQTLIGVISQRLVPCTSVLKPKLGGRAAIFEVLAGSTLQEVLSQGEASFPEINDYLRKAWSYGYITSKSYHQFEVV